MELRITSGPRVALTTMLNCVVAKTNNRKRAPDGKIVDFICTGARVARELAFGLFDYVCLIRRRVQIYGRKNPPPGLSAGGF